MFRISRSGLCRWWGAGTEGSLACREVGPDGAVNFHAGPKAVQP